MSIIRDEDTTAKKEILFFSGAGAEIDYGICTGNDFLCPIIFGKYNTSTLKGLGVKRFFEKNKTKIIKDTLLEIFNNDNCNLLEQFEFDCNNKDNLLDQIKRLNGIHNKKPINNIYFTLKDCYKNEKCYEISDNKINFYYKFINNIRILNTIDGKFNSLINYDKKDNSDKIKEIRSVYYNALLNIINSINVNQFGENEKEKIRFSELSTLLDKIYDKSFIFKITNDYLKEDSYYEIIRKIKDKCSFVTTNYTPIIENVIGDANVTHLHGELRLFENFKTLSVNSYTENKKDIFENNKEIYLPYLLVQSGVKPIICSYQINAFYDFIQKLNKCKYVIMVGYGFNGDDNHINSILREYILKKDIKLIYFAYYDPQNNKNDTKLSYLKRLFEDSVIKYIDFYTGKKNYKEIQNDLKEIFVDNTKKIFILKCLGKKVNNEITIHEVMSILINLLKGGIDNL